MAAKKKAKEVKAWAWQNAGTGHLAISVLLNGYVTVHTALTKKEALAQGVDSPRYRLVRVSIKVL